MAGLEHDMYLFFLNIDVAIGTDVIVGTDEELNKFFEEYQRGWHKTSLYVQLHLNRRQQRERIVRLRKHVEHTTLNINGFLIEGWCDELTRRVRDIRLKYAMRRFKKQISP